MLAIKTCKEQLKEKDDRIGKLTDQYKQFRQQSQREAQLMSSAIYEVCYCGLVSVRNVFSYFDTNLCVLPLGSWACR